MFRSIMALFLAVVAFMALSAPSVQGTPLPFRLAKRGNIVTNKTDTKHLTARDFNCNVDHISCCEQLLSNNEATQSLGGLLNVPISALGNVGLSCSVSRGSLSLIIRGVSTHGTTALYCLLQPLLVSAISQCKSTPVCCSQVSESGAGEKLS